MSSRRRPRGRLYVYADESGNTGNNLFDPNQPTLWACCVISNKKVDALATATIKRWREAVAPNELHGTTLGFSGIDTIAEEFYRLISRLNLSFQFIELDKSFHAALKFFDTVLDAGINPEMSPLHYNVRACRTLLLFVIVHNIDVEHRKLFWSSLLSGNEGGFREVIGHVQGRLEGEVPLDIQKRLIPALRWAYENPSALLDYGNKKQHSPNYVVFTKILYTLQSYSKRSVLPSVTPAGKGATFAGTC